MRSAPSLSHRPERPLPPPSAQVLDEASRRIREGDFQAAVRLLAGAIARTPEIPGAYEALSTAYGQLHKYEEALETCERGLRVSPADSALLGNRAAALYALARYSEALECLQQQAALLRANQKPWVSLGKVLRALGRLDEAKKCHSEACRLDPRNAEAHYGLAMAHFLAGEYREGFREHEWRWGTSGQRNHRPDFSQPLWDGRPLANRRLLLYAEQGDGDTIQFIRYTPIAKQRANNLMVVVAPALARLMTWLAEPVQILPAGSALPPFDVQCPLLTLPYLFETDASSISAPASFVVPAGMQQKWRARLGSAPGLKVGIVWAGNPAHQNDQNRSVSLKCLAPLFAISGVRFFSLQVGPASAELAGSGFAERVDDLSGDLRDYAETAAAVSQLDLVIAVDTSVAHLAGSLGTAVWMLTPFAPDWRWQLDRSDSAWYPSMRLFRQHTPGAWGEVVARIAQELAAQAGAAQLPALASRVSPRTDIRRWSNPQNLEASWNERARLAAEFIPAGATVLDLGCGAMALEGFLPFGCTYLPCDVVRRDARTVLCDFNEQLIPPAPSATHITCLGVIEYIHDAPDFLRQLRAFQIPLILSYCPADFTMHLDRKGLGWVNHMTLRDLSDALTEAGFFMQSSLRVDTNQVLIRALPAPARLRKKSRVLVLSYNNCGNFGDRLGFHLINSVLPAQAEVQYANFKPWAIPPGEFDLLVLGIGNSLFRPILTEELIALVRKTPRSVGIFGTQYRDSVDRARMAAVLDPLTLWFARYEEDLLLYGKGRPNALHLGDWLISAFPMSQWKRDETLQIGAEIWNDLPLDRTIQRIQEYRNVVSSRLHPLVCALTSAERVSFTEQREDGSGAISGKFRSLMLDIFGRTQPESSLWAFDRDLVAAYRARVLRTMADMPALFTSLLELEPPSSSY